WGGGGGYQPMAGDYDGDGKADLGLYNQGTGGWYILKSSTSFAAYFSTGWGGPEYAPVPGADFDGDGKIDITVYAQSGYRYVLKSSSNFTASMTMGFGGRGYMLV